MRQSQSAMKIQALIKITPAKITNKKKFTRALLFTLNKRVKEKKISSLIAGLTAVQ